MQDPEAQENEELVRRMSRGNQEALASIFRKLGPPLHGLATRIMEDAKEAEDVLQESFTYIWRKAKNYDPSRSTVFTWATMIVRNKAIDRLRVRRRFERARAEAAAVRDQFPKIDDTSALLPGLHEKREQVLAAVNQLTPDQREALDLAFFSGMTHEQIASKLMIPLGTVKARIRRGIIRLREILIELK